MAHCDKLRQILLKDIANVFELRAGQFLSKQQAVDLFAQHSSYSLGAFGSFVVSDLPVGN